MEEKAVTYDKLPFVCLLLGALPVVFPASDSPVIRTKLTGWNIKLNKVMGFFFFFSPAEFIWVHHGAFKHVVANTAMYGKPVHRSFKVVKLARSVQRVAEECASCHKVLSPIWVAEDHTCKLFPE